MIEAWRTGVDTPTYGADDLSGTGAKNTGGRWNRVGNAVVYCAESRALAGLETVVHLNSSGLPFNRYLVRIDIPTNVWAGRLAVTHATAPVGWDAIPEGIASLDYGDAWLNAKATAILTVPSVIVPEEHTILINPAHPDAHSIRALKVRKWLYDPRLGRV